MNPIDKLKKEAEWEELRPKFTDQVIKYLSILFPKLEDSPLIYRLSLPDGIFTIQVGHSIQINDITLLEKDDIIIICDEVFLDYFRAWTIDYKEYIFGKALTFSVEGINRIFITGDKYPGT